MEISQDYFTQPEMTLKKLLKVCFDAWNNIHTFLMIMIQPG